MKRAWIVFGMAYLSNLAIAQTKGNWQQEVNYTIQVTLDDQSHMLRGSEEFVYTNNSPATLSLLKGLGEHLVDLHGPHDHQGLLSTERQLAMLDAYAGVTELCGKYRAKWRGWRDKSDALDDFQTAGMADARELDLLSHQLEEIDAAGINISDESELESTYQRASNSSHLSESLSRALALLGGSDDSLNHQIGQLQKVSRDLEKLDPALRDTLEGVDKTALELQEMEYGLAQYLEDLNTDPAELLRLE